MHALNDLKCRAQLHQQSRDRLHRITSVLSGGVNMLKKGTIVAVRDSFDDIASITAPCGAMCLV